ncbi:hypothetical protein APR51_27945 [Variovorax paradoxus]|jgi:hypothetical protein|nr:hypothetical protein APR52_22055 [Variovorax paradoxus]KPV17163.1 hypothetical protein APR51_27945 [Variovorax paradoxus]MBS81018.1 hypothetical protein [Variovorax sp.]
MKDSNMKKTLFILAAALGLLASSGAALAQPHPGPGYDRPHMAPVHRKHKVWVPAHREHGRYVRGHYVWR